MNFYFQCASVLDRLDSKKGSIKSILSTLPDSSRKRIAALVIETLKYKPVLSEAITAAALLKNEKKITSKNLALVLVHDALLTPGGIQAGSGPLKEAVLRHKTRLNSELQRLKVKRGVRSNTDLVSTNGVDLISVPRYVRVNTHKWSTERAVDAFIKRGFQLGDPKQPKCFSQDEHIPDLLHFPGKTAFQDDPTYTSGRIILQDKASCFPAAVLAPPASGEAAVIDATAAPGNKTSHLSALMKGKGTLFAFERDKRRFGTLKAMLARAGCDTHVRTYQVDFLETDPTDDRFACVTHILLDPSCSGSGIVNRLDYLTVPEMDSGSEMGGESESSVQASRLAKLSSFQLSIIRHAMKFPAVTRIVYSTCSIHSAENEEVVRDALLSSEAIEADFVLAPRSEVLPTWPRRGIAGILDTEETESVVRCSPEDAMNGFFVACFVRRGRSDATPPLPRKRRASNSTDGNTAKLVEREVGVSTPDKIGQQNPSRKTKRRKRT